MTELEITYKKVRIFKNDRRTRLKQFFSQSKKRTAILNLNERWDTFAFSFDGYKMPKPNIAIPSKQFFLHGAIFALVKNELFVFGGFVSIYRVRKSQNLKIIELRSRNWKAANGRTNPLQIYMDICLGLQHFPLKTEKKH